jgi:hypothetical protein
MKTVKTLKKCGYTGEWFILIDDGDSQQEEYKRLYKNHVVVFSKKDISVDTGDNFDDDRIVLYARIAVQPIAAKMGYTHILELDDDYTSFKYRVREEGNLGSRNFNMDKVIKIFLDFLDASGAETIAFWQTGDLIGGADNRRLNKALLRKAMNCFFCKTDSTLPFCGRINEDVNMYVLENLRGKKIFTYLPIVVNQGVTQENVGGLTDIYLDMGTYVKSFYSVMYAPSCVKIWSMGDKHERIHHRIEWKNCAPMILPEAYKKR